MILELKAQHDALQKIASVRDPIKAISEFIWNALDADATRISIELGKTPFGGVQDIKIIDNGSGISQERALGVFENLGASWKRDKPRSLKNRIMHGKEGQGRLRFFSLADRAIWHSVSEQNNTFQKIKIQIGASSLHRSEVDLIPPPVSETQTGTIVELHRLKDTFDWLGSDLARTEFAAVFAPYVLQYPRCSDSF